MRESAGAAGRGGRIGNLCSTPSCSWHSFASQVLRGVERGSSRGGGERRASQGVTFRPTAPRGARRPPSQPSCGWRQAGSTGAVGKRQMTNGRQRVCNKKGVQPAPAYLTALLSAARSFPTFFGGLQLRAARCARFFKRPAPGHQHQPALLPADCPIPVRRSPVFRISAARP